MKTALAIFGQFFLFVLFVALFFTASNGILAIFHLDPFHGLRWFVSHPTPATTRYYRPSGLLLVTLLFLVVFAIEAAAKRMRTAGKWTTVVYLLAVAVGLLAKFGWILLDPNS